MVDGLIRSITYSRLWLIFLDAFVMWQHSFISTRLLQPKFGYFLGGENRKMEQIVQVRKARFPRTLLEKTRGGKNV